MKAEPPKICRKCATENRADNIYCKKCGAVLDVKTVQIKAQAKPVAPKLRGIGWRYVLIGVFVMLGFVCFFGGAAFLVSKMLGFFSGGFESIADNLLSIGIGATALFVVAFGISGVVLAWLAKERITNEVSISATVVIAALGAAGAAVTVDIAIVAALLFVPSVVSAVLGVKMTIK